MIKLFPYQLAWIKDPSRFSIFNKTRQAGISWAQGFDCVRDCVRNQRTRWYYLSISQERAYEAIAYCALHAEAIREISSGSWGAFDPYKNKGRIDFPNGSSIIGLPANPRTARGASGNIVLDEFAHQQDAAKIFQALGPVTTWGYKIRVISTPNGAQGAFHMLWEDNSGLWSKHEIDIYNAVKQGMPADINVLKQICMTEEDWLQEYCCAFLDESNAWLSYALIEKAYNRSADMTFDAKKNTVGPIYAGLDLARSRDLTVLYLLEKRPDGYITRGIEIMRNMPWSAQEAVINGYMPIITALAVDETGSGNHTAETLARRWGSKVEPVTFSNKINSLMATQLKKEFEDEAIWIPDCPDLRKDLHSMRRSYTPAGNVKFNAPNTKDGHADRFWALALAIYKSTQSDCSIPEYWGGGSKRW